MTTLIYSLLVGLAVGWLAGKIMTGRSLAPARSLVAGVIGAVLGGFLFGLLGFTVGGLLGSLVTATIGAILLLFLLQNYKR